MSTTDRRLQGQEQPVRAQPPADRPVDVRFVSRNVDKRARFFVVAAILCALLVPVTPSELQLVGEVLVVVYLALALASWLDFRSRR
jgi:hypothetical protein